MSFKDHFSSTAAAYAAARPTYPDELFRFIAEHAPACRVAWDCATGNGQAARDLARYFRRVIATDASEEQIARAVPCEGVEYHVGRAEHSALPDRSADVATVATAVHWFDFNAFYPEVARVLVPGGLLAVWSYGWPALTPAVDDIVREYAHGTVGPYWPPERRYVDDGYKTLPFPLREIRTPRLEMRADYTLAHLVGYLTTWSSTQRYREQVGQDPIPPLRERLAAAWGDAPTREVRWPINLRAGHAD